MTTSVSDLKFYFQGEVPFSELSRSNKVILIAVSTIMALGMIFAYSLCAPWFVTLSLFALALLPLFPIGKSYLTTPRESQI